MAQRGRPRKVKPDTPKRPRGRPAKPKPPKKPHGRPSGLYGKDVLTILNAPPNKLIRFEYATERECNSKYISMRRAVKQLNRDIVVRKVRHRIEVCT